MSNTGSNQQSVATQAALVGESIFQEVRWARTGDAVSDCMAGIRAVCDHSGLSARQVQYMMECYVKLYKDAADDNDLRLGEASLVNRQVPGGSLSISALSKAHACNTSRCNISAA